MIGIGLLYHDIEKDRDGVILLGDKNIPTDSTLLYEATNIVPVKEFPSVVFAFPGVSTAIQMDFVHKTYEFLEEKEIKDCGEFYLNFPSLYQLYKAMSEFYSQDGEDFMLDFLIGLSDEIGMAELYYVKVGNKVEFEVFGSHTKYAFTIFGHGEIGLFLRDIVGAFLKNMDIIPRKSAIEIGLSAIKIAERFYRNISPKIDIYDLSDGKYYHFYDEIVQETYSYADAKSEVMFQLLFDLINYPESYNVQKIMETIFRREEE